MASTWGAKEVRRRRPGAVTLISNESGSTLVVVMIFAIIMLISAMAMMELGAQDAALAMRDINTSQAFYNAEAGAERGQAWMAGQSAFPTTAVTPFSDSPEIYAGGLYHVNVTPDATGPRTIYTVTSYSTVDGRSRAIEIDITPTAFTDYLYYTNRDVGPGSPGYFRSGDVIDGPIHVNDEIAIWGNPIFESRVESTSGTILYHNNWSPLSLATLDNAPYDVPEFREGCDLNATTLPWLGVADLNTLAGMAGLTLANKKIVFGRDDGSGPMLGWLSYSKINKNQWTDVDLSSFNGIIYVTGTCHVSGIVDGQVTVVSNGQIDIVDDLVVADSGANGPNPGCDDIIGLVAATKANVAETAANYNDCVLHAHVMAMNNQASLVERHSHGSPRGTLTIWGGLAQDKWGPVGTGYYDWQGQFHVLTGYERDFHYDWRLQSMLPPGYNAIVFKGGGMARLAWREVTPIDLTGYVVQDG
jgi:hypothetical protein